MGVSHSSGPEKLRPCTTRHKASSQSLFLVHRVVIALCPYELGGGADFVFPGGINPMSEGFYGVITS